MKKVRFYAVFFTFLLLGIGAASDAHGQDAREKFRGTVISFGSGTDTRARTGSFDLIINGTTSDAQAKTFLKTLQDKGQDSLLDDIDDQDLGRFSVGANVGVPINVVRESIVDGKRRVFVVFKRWTQFAELRGGYRSLDYPFGVVELFIDPRTGKGEGTYIAAARVRWDDNQVEIENFGTYPARLAGVTTSIKAR